jgi:hypothetical protein
MKNDQGAKKVLPGADQLADPDPIGRRQLAASPRAIPAFPRPVSRAIEIGKRRPGPRRTDK